MCLLVLQDEKFFPAARKGRSYRGMMKTKIKLPGEDNENGEEDEEEDDILSEAAEAALAVASGVRTMASSMLSKATAPKKTPAPRARKTNNSKKAPERPPVPSPSISKKRGKFEHFRNAVIVIQVKDRRH
jgi:hypothetical protein